MHHRLQALLNSYLSGNLTPEQHRELLTLLDDTGAADQLGEQLRQQISTGDPIIPNELPGTEDRIVRGLLEKIRREPAVAPQPQSDTRPELQTVADAQPGAPLANPTPVRPLYRRWIAAAAAILIITSGAYLWLAKTKPAPAVATRRTQTDIAPGGNKAILTLADGKTITLDSTADGAIAQQGNATIIKSANGQIAYQPTGTATADANLLNTLRTPFGGQYHLTLPDGTGVWLNSASAITYPAAFTGRQRK
ncbi:MAG TPA: hypothetical protein VKQ52_04310, partial [Puia sp.]|nr:hypothetical protein [Puia sp.]